MTHARNSFSFQSVLAYLKNILYSLALKHATEQDLPTVKQNRVAFVIALFAAILGDIVFFLIYIHVGAWGLASVVGANILLLMLDWIFFRYNLNFTLVRMLPILSTAFVLSFVSAVLGERSGAENLLITIVGVASALFADQERKWIVTTVIACLGSLIFFKQVFPGLALWPDSQLLRSEYSSEFFYYICQFIAAFSLVVVFFNLRHQQDAAVAELEERKAKMQHTSQLAALGEMAGGIAHEINNPLAIIQGRLSLVEVALKKANFSDDKVFYNIKDAAATVIRISKIVKSMKSISRDGTNDSFLTLDIGQVLINTIQLCEEKLKSQGVVLDSSGIKEQIFCSGQEISLGQVFLNLLNNSVDAIAEQSNQWIRISMHVKNGQVQITFVDSGSGISSAVAAKMFHPFYTTKDVGKGTGLGLSISRRIVENHGGQLYYDNHAKNTTMVVVLPINVGMYSKQI